MSVVKKLADRVAVMDSGRIVEQGTTYDIFSNPRHETTKKFVGSVTGGSVPDWLLAKITPAFDPGESAVLRVAFAGGKADRPVLSRISRSYGIDINILHGQIESIADRPFGTLIISMAAEPVVLDRIIDELKTGGNVVEHLGYVA